MTWLGLGLGIPLDDFAGGGGGPVPVPGVDSLDFNSSANSQYLVVLFFGWL